MPLFHTFLLMALSVEPGAEIPVWSGGVPGPVATSKIPEAVRITDAGDHVVSNVHNPSITPYLAKTGASGFAVIIAPGGGHRELWSTHEGHNIARWLSDHGVSAFVLKYRLAREKDSIYTIEGDALQDTKQAILLVRKRAQEWGIDSRKVGVMGFSAGGELAALAGMRYESDAEKPAFFALIYPAIPKELRLSKDMPPAFLACGENDRENIAQGLPELYLKMKQAGASAELHVYAGVGHGFGLRPTLKGPVSTWLVRFHEWLQSAPLT